MSAYWKSTEHRQHRREQKTECTGTWPRPKYTHGVLNYLIGQGRRNIHKASFFHRVLLPGTFVGREGCRVSIRRAIHISPLPISLSLESADHQKNSSNNNTNIHSFSNLKKKKKTTLLQRPPASKHPLSRSTAWAPARTCQCLM